MVKGIEWDLSEWEEIPQVDFYYWEKNPNFIFTDIDGIKHYFVWKKHFDIENGDY